MTRRRLPEPFTYRGRWRAQVTLSNGTRPQKDFDRRDQARQWVAEQIAADESALQPQLGGPTRATLAQALRHYAELYTVAKGGYASELNRINHYLQAAGMPALRVEIIPAPSGSKAPATKHLLEVGPRTLPSAFQKHVDDRRGLRAKTYQFIAELAVRRCSTLSAADMRRLMTTMATEGYSDTTIQKEMALLKHLFNMAAQEWNWRGFENPVRGLKLGKSNDRFVVLNAEQKTTILAAATQCDNPLIWPLVVVAMETTLRSGSLLALEAARVDLEQRVINVDSKTGVVNIPLSLQAVEALRGLLKHPSGRVFPMSANALNMAWEGIREKAGLPKLQFRDLRHVGATQYARMGLNAHQLQKILGHKTLHQAMVYINLVNSDILDAMDRGAAGRPLLVPPPMGPDTQTSQRQRRSSRLIEAVRRRAAGAPAERDNEENTSQRPDAAASRPAPNMVLAPTVAATGDDESTRTSGNILMFRPRALTRAA